MAGPLLVSWAAQAPECPPATRASAIVAPPPEVFHPDVPVSNPGLPTRFARAMTWAVACDGWPAESLTVTVTVYVPVAV